MKKQDMLPNDVENPSFSVGIGALASHPDMSSPSSTSKPKIAAQARQDLRV